MDGYGRWYHIDSSLCYVDYSICTTQLDCSCYVSFTCQAQFDRSGYVSSTGLAQLDRSGHVSSTFNITSSLSLSLSLSLPSLSLSGCSPSNIVVLLLKVSHNAPHVLDEQVTWDVYPWLQVPCTEEQCKETWSTPRVWYIWAIWTSKD